MKGNKQAKTIGVFLVLFIILGIYTVYDKYISNKLDDEVIYLETEPQMANKNVTPSKTPSINVKEEVSTMSSDDALTVGNELYKQMYDSYCKKDNWKDLVLGFTGTCLNSTEVVANTLYSHTKLSVKDVSNEHISFLATSFYCQDGNWGNGNCNEATSQTIENNFSLKKDNGKWKITDYTSPDLNIN